MEGIRPRRLVALLVIAAALPACSARVPVEELPDPRATLEEAGKRLSRSRSVDELTALATRGERVLAALTRRERDALGRGALRFRVDRPAIVEVAAREGSIPFWLADQGFVKTHSTVRVAETAWPLFRKEFPAGWVGLGVNALDRKAPAHYAVFVRDAGGGPAEVGAIVPGDWQVALADDGVSVASGVALPIRGLPDALRGATLLRAPHDRRHATALAHGRAWKTHVASSRTPDQVAIAFGPDPSRSLVWTWRTEPGVAATALRLASADLTPIRVIRGDSRLVESPDLLNDPTIRRHRVAVDGLEPGTEYAYAPGDGSAVGWSPWRKVRTAPERPRSFRFLYLGDAQCGLEAWGKLLRQAHARNPDAGFILLAGDLVDRGNERTNWDHFFLRAAGVFDAVPLMPCVGNHEYLDRGPQLYRAFFALPCNGPEGIDPGLIYSFEYADAFIAVLDSSQAIVDPRNARRQAEWLDGVLSRTRATWKFVMFHHPVYASHPTRQSPVLRDTWVPVFDKHRVDIVFQGHDHAYSRTHPLRAHRRAAPDDRGTTYVISVSGGKYYPQRLREETAVGLANLSTYQTIDIQVPERRLTYRARDAEGREVDRLVLEK